MSRKSDKVGTCTIGIVKTIKTVNMLTTAPRMRGTERAEEEVPSANHDTVWRPETREFSWHWHPALLGHLHQMVRVTVQFEQIFEIRRQAHAVNIVA